MHGLRGGLDWIEADGVGLMDMTFIGLDWIGIV